MTTKELKRRSASVAPSAGIALRRLDRRGAPAIATERANGAAPALSRPQRGRSADAVKQVAGSGGGARTPLSGAEAAALASGRARHHTDLTIYLRQINGVPLLTPEEERELGWRIINDGDAEAKERMITSNLRLVIAIAKQYANRGVPLPDLVEEGNLGLLRAVDGFDPAQGTRFSTYAGWWIKQAIRRMIACSAQPIHVPAYMMELVQRMHSATRDLEKTHNRPPTPSELSRALKLPPRKITAIKRAMKAMSCPTHAPSGLDGEALDFGQLIADTRHGSPDAPLTRREECDLVLRLLETMSERDARIVRLRFGLEGMTPRTLRDVGAEMGLTRERVRQIEAQTLKRLQQMLLESERARQRDRKAG